MPTMGFGFEPDWKAIARRRAEYRRKLIAKGVVDGGSKMRKLMCRKNFGRGYD